MFEFRYVPLPSLDSAYVKRHSTLGPIWKWLLISLGVILYAYPFIYTVEHQLYQENAPIGYGKILTPDTCASWPSIIN